MLARILLLFLFLVLNSTAVSSGKEACRTITTTVPGKNTAVQLQFGVLGFYLCYKMFYETLDAKWKWHTREHPFSAKKAMAVFTEASNILDIGRATRSPGSQGWLGRLLNMLAVLFIHVKIIVGLLCVTTHPGGIRETSLSIRKVRRVLPALLATTVRRERFVLLTKQQHKTSPLVFLSSECYQ
nr:unnamed protein product [Haemonchus contortus]